MIKWIVQVGSAYGWTWTYLFQKSGRKEPKENCHPEPIRQSSDVIMLRWVPTFVFERRPDGLFSISVRSSASYHHQDVVWPCVINLQSLRYTSLRLHVQNPLSIIKVENSFCILWCYFQAVSSLQVRWDKFTSDSGWPWMQTAVAK